MSENELFEAEKVEDEDEDINEGDVEEGIEELKFKRPWSFIQKK